MPIQQMFLGAGGAVDTKTYVDDVFSTYLWAGNGTSGRTITNNIGVSGEGALVWIKNRTTSGQNVLTDTVRGANETIYSDSSNANYTHSNLLTAFTTTGFTVGNDSYVNGSGNDYTSWTFRKAPGFFDVVTWTGNGSNRTIAHSLGSVPGMIMVKRIDTGDSWFTYHKSLGGTKRIYLDASNAAVTNSTAWNDTDPTSSVFSVGTDSGVNASGGTYVAYVFAGGKGTTDKAVNFDGTDDRLTLASSSDVNFGTGDFTVEFWLRLPDGDNTHVGFFQISGTSGGLDTNYSSSLGLGWHEIYNCWQLYRGGGYTNSSSFSPIANKWYHAAVVRSSGTTKVYIDGKEVISLSDSHDYNYNNLVVGGYYNTSYLMKGDISNFRIVKGQALYTTNFNVPNDPLTQTSQNAVSSNVKLLCCNGSTTTAATVTPGTITAVGNPTVTTNNSIFDDSGGFVFGENEDQDVIKCGSYVGNGSATGPEINLGWEPQYVLIKNSSSGSTSWNIWDSMRGIRTGGNDIQLYPNENQEEYTGADRVDLTSTGFKLKQNNSLINTDGDTYIYICIRRPDGYVGKPADAGTDVFAMDTGAGNSTTPNFDSGFPVDFAFSRDIDSTDNWYTFARLTGKGFMYLQTTNSESDANDWSWDSNVGWQQASWGSDKQSWMWKRHAGFDLVCYKGNAVEGRQIPHSLSKTPEMMWVKKRNGSKDWICYHKGLNGGTNPEQYHLHLNTNVGEAQSVNAWNNQAPTSTHFVVDDDNHVNGDNDEYIAMLFASVDGISSVGFYDGNSSGATVTTGFTPRFILIKRTNSTGNWAVFDTSRSLGASGSSPKKLRLNSSSAQDVGAAYLYTTSTGFFVNHGYDGDMNTGSGEYIYYAHA